MEDAWGIRTPAHSTWRSDTVRLLTTLDRVDEALALADEDVARARRFGDPRPLGIALRAAGLARQGRSIRACRSRSRSCGPRPRGSSSRSRCSSSAPRSGAPGAAPRRATRSARRSTSPPSAARPRVAAKAHDELVAAGARPRRDPIESRSRLTASETRVAKMAAEGMTNREIAQALFLTEKTIEVHLTNTYRKLDIGSRSQLPRALGESLGGAPEAG